MARVFLSGELRAAAGGAESLSLDARNVRELIDALTRSHPDLAPHFTAGLAVAIDGEIFPDGTFEALEPDSEVHFLPRVRGG